MKTFTFFWLTGKAEVLKGENSADALNNAGYGNGALRALDFYSDGDKVSEYFWDKEKRFWDKKI